MTLLTKSTLLKKILLAIAALILTLLLAIWAFSPIIIRHIASNTLEANGLGLSPSSSIRYNPFLSKVTIKQLEINQGDRRLLAVNSLGIDLALVELLRNGLKISDFTLSGLYLELDLDQTDLLFGDLNLLAESEVGAETEHHSQHASSELGDFRLLLPRLVIEDTTIQLNAKMQSHLLQIEKLQIRNSHLSQHNQTLDLQLEAALNNAKLFAHLSTELRDFIGPLKLQGEITSLDLSALQTLLPQGLSITQGKLSASTEQTVQFTKNDMQLQAGHAHAQIDSLILQQASQTLSSNKIEFEMETLALQSDHQFNGNLKSNFSISAKDSQLSNNENDLQAWLANLDLSIRDFKLHFIEQQIDELSLAMKLVGKEISAIANSNSLRLGKFDLSDEEIKLTFSDNQLENIDLQAALELNELHGSDGNIVFNSSYTLLEADNISANIVDGAAKSARITSQLQTNDGKVVISSNNDTLAKWQNMQLRNLQLDYREEVFAQLEFFSLNNIEASIHKDLKPLVALDSLEISNITALQDSAEISNIEISGLHANATINTEQKLLNLIDLNFLENYSEQSEKIVEELEEVKNQILSSRREEAESEPPEFAVALDKLFFSNSNTIYFRDQNVSPNYERTLTLDDFSLGPMDNRLPQQKSYFHLAGHTDKHEKFKFQGNVTPFTAKPNAKLDGDIRELNLPGLSPYIKDSLKFDIDTGQLDADIEMEIVKAEIDGKVKLEIRQINMTPVDSHKEKSIKNSTAMPLNVALTVLENRNGIVKLNIPLNGRTDQSAIGVDGVISVITQAAIIPASKLYVLGAINPLLAVAYLADGQLKLTLAPLEYRATQIEPDATNQEFLQNLIDILKDKENMTIKLCPVSVPEDLGLANDIEITDKVTLNELKGIGQLRQEALKSYLIHNGGIASKRLLLCTPKIAFGKQAKPLMKLER